MLSYYVGYDLVTGYIFDESYHILVMGDQHEKLISQTKAILGENPSQTSVRLSSNKGYELINKYMPGFKSSCLQFLKRSQDICKIPDEKNNMNSKLLTKIYQQSLGSYVMNQRVQKQVEKVDINQITTKQLEESLLENRAKIKECSEVSK